ncbi:PepSY-associated TM helix domain-containing protein [Rhodococcoides corynebacterioides]|uniref:PepSY-associated TM helix domain-containing protein n=1 Tax=Rhodococcoides corynebacterioides TaxID=53972 RepID=UPI001C9A3856|nr:PepSY domain-containing protein [Rhodococcus corynebacterioides]MBY6351624.1 PepSY domain-containing protein [Rhodococcus corynebacterioides]MBY6364728.1 PepSY domain-containing protein [Rhodococcus corynebacterioides]
MFTPEKIEQTTDLAPPPTRRWRPLILRLHFYAGVVVAPFILIAAVTGGLYAIAPTLENVVYRDLLHTDDTGPALPISDQVLAAQAERPDLTVAAVRPATAAGDTTRVIFTDPSLGESKRTAVFVDPATATAVGESTVYGSSGSLPLRTWLSELHRTLHLGEAGRLYSELAASWLGVVALGGLFLWVERYRRRRSRSDARLFTVDRTTRGRRRTLNLHGAGGAWIVVGLVFLSATGLTWSAYAGANITDVRSALSWTTPTLDTDLTGHAGHSDDEHAGHVGHGASDATASTAPVDVRQIDGVLAVARENDVTGPVEASIPASGDTAFQVSQLRDPWVFSTDSIAIDGASDRVVDVQRFADWPLAAKLTTWGISLHMGVLFGLVTQLAMLALAVALVAVIVGGYRMWFQRRPSRTGGTPVGRPPQRGALRRLSPGAVVGLAVATVAIGWFVPLLGVSLLAFLAVDVVTGRLRRA